MDGTLTDMPDWEAMGMVGGQLGYFELPGKTPAKGTAARSMTRWKIWPRCSSQPSCTITTAWTSSKAAALGLLMELRQRDLITVEDLDGIDLKWGDVHAVEALVKKIVAREGVGDNLANGTYETAKYFADKKSKPEIMNYTVTTHRYGQPAHDVRSGGDKDAMEYVTVCRPTEHTGGGTAGFKKGDWVAAIAGQNSKCATDSLGLLLVPGRPLGWQDG